MVMYVLFKKKGLFTASDAKRVIDIVSRENEREIIIMCEKIDDDAKRRLWDYAKGVELMSDLTGESREVKVEILEGYVSDKVKGIEL